MLIPWKMCTFPPFGGVCLSNSSMEFNILVHVQLAHLYGGRLCCMEKLCKAKRWIPSDDKVGQ